MTEETHDSSGNDHEAVLARAKHAVALADWLETAPEPQGTTTVAKSFSEILGETVRELNRLATCHDIVRAKQRIEDNLMMSDLSPAQKKGYEEALKDLENAARRNNCSATIIW